MKIKAKGAGDFLAKSFDVHCEFKDISDRGTFSGYASIFGNVDLGGDIIERGAFTELVKTKSGKVRILNQHNTRQPIGAANVHQDDKGLHFDGALVLDVPAAREAHALMKADVLDGMSIGYDILPGGAEITEAGIRKLKSLKLYEISPVTFGMNPLARIESVKAVPVFGTVRECEDWLRDEARLTNSAAKEFVARFKRVVLLDARDEPPLRDGAADESELGEMVKWLDAFEIKP